MDILLRSISQQNVPAIYNLQSKAMDYSTGFFLDDDELFSLFATDSNPPLMKSRLFRLNVTNGIVELQGMKGNILAIRKLKQANSSVLVKFNSGSTTEVEGRLQELGFATSPQSTREGFSEFQRVIEPPSGYTQQCDTIKVIWRSWWPIESKSFNGRAVVLVFHEGQWLDVHKIEAGTKPTIYTNIPGKNVYSHTAVPWAIATQFAKGHKVQDRVKQAHLSHVNHTDERSWAQETVMSGAQSTLSQTLTEIQGASNRWIKNINSIPTDVSGYLDESREIEQRKLQLVRVLEYLISLSMEKI
jgi:hypothetical protein